MLVAFDKASLSQRKIIRDNYFLANFILCNAINFVVTNLWLLFYILSCNFLRSDVGYLNIIRYISYIIL